MKTTRKQRGGVTGKGFLPGQSGNPAGRPRTAKFNEAAREVAAEIDKKGDSGAERLARYCFRRAMKGSTKHAVIFLGYAFGRPRQLVEVTGKDGEAIAFRAMTLSREEIQMRVAELVTKAAADPEIAARLKL